jgi:hypothetical protein
MGNLWDILIKLYSVIKVGGILTIQRDLVGLADDKLLLKFSFYSLYENRIFLFFCSAEEYQIKFNKWLIRLEKNCYNPSRNRNFFEHFNILCQETFHAF